jgi:hypothetical protein
LIMLEFFQKRAVGLGGDQLVDHIHCTGKENFHIGVACSAGNAFCQESLACARISYENDIRALPYKLQIKQIQDSALLFLSCLVVFKVKLIDTDSSGDLCLLPLELYGALAPFFQLQISQAV